MFDVAGDTETDATAAGAGVLTVTAAEPTFPSLEAVIDAVPARIAVTSPDPETLAMALLLELQLIDRPVRTLLFASRVTAESCTVPPTWRLDVGGDTDTDATATGAGALTLSAAEAVLPSLAAEIAALPDAIAETSPLADTVAMPALLLLHVTGRPLNEFPTES